MLQTEAFALGRFYNETAKLETNQEPLKISMEGAIRASIVVPTLNAGSSWLHWLKAIKEQARCFDPVLVIDSSSDDATVEQAGAAGCKVVTIPRRQFNHGGTRQWAVDRHLPDTDVVVFLTQDALLVDCHAVENLVRCFRDPMVGAAYGRQLPHANATPIAAHARLFNYPPNSHVRRLSDAERYGIKTAFISNSFAAYRRAALQAVGGFPSDTIMSEDTYVAAKILLSGWHIAYCAEAQVRHSHDYTHLQEFKRYFDIGVFFTRESWIRAHFGQAESEGSRFVRSEIRYLLSGSPSSIPYGLVRSALKYLGYKLGHFEGRLPLWLKRRISMHRYYWDSDRDGKRNDHSSKRASV